MRRLKKHRVLRIGIASSLDEGLKGAKGILAMTIYDKVVLASSKVARAPDQPKRENEDYYEPWNDQLKCAWKRCGAEIIQLRPQAPEGVDDGGNSKSGRSEKPIC
ncbi:MAG: hypothetical protein NNA30_02200 [Nitrospira sp.]|nr:hypothetical protein [Nitrospira sp.]